MSKHISRAPSEETPRAAWSTMGPGWRCYLILTREGGRYKRLDNCGHVSISPLTRMQARGLYNWIINKPEA